MNSINDFNANCVIASSDVASAGCLNKGVSALKSQQLEILERDAQQSYGVVKHNVSVGEWNISACGIQAHNTEYFPGDEVTYNDLTYVAKVSIAPNATTTSPADDSSKWTSDFGNCTKSTQFKDLTLSGNLTVNGTTTTLDVETLSVEDANITIGTGANATVGSGITVGDDSKHLISYAGADTACLKNVTATSITTNTNGSLTVHGSGSFSSGTGAVTLGGDVTIASGKDINMSGASTFKSGTGDVTLNGDVTIDSGKDINMSGTSTFTSGTGDVTLKGNVTIDSGKSLTMGTGNITTTGTISATTFTGSFSGDITTSNVTLNNTSTNYIQVGELPTNGSASDGYINAEGNVAAGGYVYGGIVWATNKLNGEYLTIGNTTTINSGRCFIGIGICTGSNGIGAPSSGDIHAVDICASTTICSKTSMFVTTSSSASNAVLNKSTIDSCNALAKSKNNYMSCSLENSENGSYDMPAGSSLYFLSIGGGSGASTYSPIPNVSNGGSGAIAMGAVHNGSNSTYTVSFTIGTAGENTTDTGKAGDGGPTVLTFPNIDTITLGGGIAGEWGNGDSGMGGSAGGVYSATSSIGTTGTAITIGTYNNVKLEMFYSSNGHDGILTSGQLTPSAGDGYSVNGSSQPFDEWFGEIKRRDKRYIIYSGSTTQGEHGRGGSYANGAKAGHFWYSKQP